MFDKDKQNLLGIIESIEKIEEYVSPFNNADEFFVSKINFDATMMNFIVIGEMITKMSEEFIQKHSQIDWVKIKSFRNIIAHDYFGVDAEEVWQITKTHLVQFKKLVNKILHNIQ